MKPEAQVVEDQELKIPAPSWKPSSVLQWVEHRAQANPDAGAVISGAGTMTYGELNRRADRMAHHFTGPGRAWVWKSWSEHGALADVGGGGSGDI